MSSSHRTVAVALVGAGFLLLAGPARPRVFAQDQPPNRREFTVTAKEFRFTPQHIEVAKDDLVKLTVRSEDGPYSLTIDAYRISKRVPAGGATTFEFRADQVGTFPFYSNLTSDSRHKQTRGELVVRAQ